MFGNGETVQRLAYVATTRNAHGQEVHTRAPGVDIDDVGVAPGMPTGTPSESVAPVTLYLAFDVETHPLDQWRVRGVLCDVDVDTSGRWRSPFTGWEAGQAIALRRARG